MLDSTVIRAHQQTTTLRGSHEWHEANEHSHARDVAKRTCARVRKTEPPAMMALFNDTHHTEAQDEHYPALEAAVQVGHGLVAVGHWASGRRRVRAALLAWISKDLVPHRPGRVEPRRRKRRPKSYSNLTKP